MAADHWSLRRNCAMTPRQALLAWALPVALLLGVGLFAGMLRWWWVLVFSLATTAGLAIALCVYARHALDGETLRLADDGLLHVEQQCGLRQRHLVYRASVVHLETSRDGSLLLWAGRTPTRVGSHVVPARREQAARELRRALRRQRDSARL